MSEERSGLVVMTAGGRRFLGPAAGKVVLLGPVTPVPGLPVPAEGVALAEGRVVTVVGLIPPGSTAQAVLCEAGGEALALRCEVLAAGRFPAAAGGVEHEGEPVEELDVEGLHEAIEGSLWAEQARQRARRSAVSARARSSAPAPSSGKAGT